MVPTHRNKPGPLEVVEDAARFRPAIDQVPNGEQAIDGSIEIDLLESGLETREMAVDIPDDKVAAVDVALNCLNKGRHDDSLHAW
ncbi:hypothetical protein BCCH1_79630 (plasmid) [Burkholderia contaminans]|uniref:Uncharacterized protein n=1 Tax=Burkholderia contaminans TaxID=488447 RepID=A0A250LLN7_9BURK|nr:hypothetical protein BCCH1_79630 [Burkholderia contaminans]